MRRGIFFIDLDGRRTLVADLGGGGLVYFGSLLADELHFHAYLNKFVSDKSIRWIKLVEGPHRLLVTKMSKMQECPTDNLSGA